MTYESILVSGSIYPTNINIRFVDKMAPSETSRKLDSEALFKVGFHKIFLVSYSTVLIISSAGNSIVHVSYGIRKSLKWTFFKASSVSQKEYTCL